MKTDGFRILTESWRIVRRNRFLWVLAFFIALAGGGAQGYGLWVQTPIPRGLTGYSPLHRVGEEIAESAGFNEAFTAVFVAAGVLIALIAVAVSVFAQASAVGGVAERHAGRECDLKRSSWWGRKSFRRYLALMISYLLLVLVISIPSIIYWRAVGNGGGTVVPCLGGLLLALVLIFIWVLGGMILEIAARYVVLAGSGIRESLKRAISLFRADFREVTVAWLYVMVVTLGGAIAMAVLLGILAGPLARLFALAYRNHSVLLVTLSIATFLLTWAATSALAGGFAVTGSAIWTLTFIELEPGLFPRSQTQSVAGSNS